MFQHPDIEILEHENAHLEKRAPLWVPILCGSLCMILWIGGFTTTHLWFAPYGSSAFALWIITMCVLFVITALTCPLYVTESWRIRIRGSSVREVLTKIQTKYNTEACAIDIWKCTPKE